MKWKSLEKRVDCKKLKVEISKTESKVILVSAYRLGQSRLLAAGNLTLR